ncbi:MAG TPA: class I SAM-dependent methyltransferase [Acidimicrobiia bacterium]|nr:class I SAM-dependent methyltransferase [Acidimicrobiia bacterium]
MAVESRAFDRAASFYDRTRGLSPEATARVTELLRGELNVRGRCLEIGVGTGRIAWPLHQAGIAMVGVDLSQPMMDVLVEKAGGTPPFLLVQGDATVLPFPDRRFGAAIASHVFHLIPAWRAALGELVRVVRPGGVVLSSRGGRDLEGPLAAATVEFQACIGSDARHIGATHAGSEVEDAMADLGAEQRVLPVVRDTRTTTVGTMIKSLEAGQWSWAWGVPPARLHEAAEHTREWAGAQIGPLDAPVVVESQIDWKAFDLA